MQTTKKKRSAAGEKFFGHTRDLLSKVWDQWIAELGHTPTTAKKKMMKAIKDLNIDEAKGKKIKTKIKTAIKKKTKRVVSKAKKAKRSAR